LRAVQRAWTLGSPPLRHKAIQAILLEARFIDLNSLH
jgi:hypothetical protein